MLFSYTAIREVSTVLLLGNPLYDQSLLGFQVLFGTGAGLLYLSEINVSFARNQFSGLKIVISENGLLQIYCRKFKDLCIF